MFLSETNAENSMNPGWQILSGFELKLIGTVLMVFDHLHEMFYLFGVPVWFTWLGRPVAPIFLFLCAEGYHYTRSRARYMLLLLIGFEFMSVVSHALMFSMRSDDLSLINNIFGTLLLSLVYMWLADTLREAAREKNPRSAALALCGMIAPFAIGIAPFAMTESMPLWLKIAILKYVPNPVTAEGGIWLIVMGVLFHVFRGKRLIQVAIPLVYGLLTYFAYNGDAQSLMAFAAIPILMYSGQRGKSGQSGQKRRSGTFDKYFFYVFYPAHLCVFYIIAWHMSN